MIAFSRAVAKPEELMRMAVASADVRPIRLTFPYQHNFLSMMAQLMLLSGWCIIFMPADCPTKKFNINSSAVVGLVLNFYIHTVILEKSAMASSHPRGIKR
jgi:hypothetical protein